jgi:hypothetical protein
MTKMKKGRNLLVFAAFCLNIFLIYIFNGVNIN